MALRVHAAFSTRHSADQLWSDGRIQTRAVSAGLSVQNIINNGRAD